MQKNKESRYGFFKFGTLFLGSVQVPLGTFIGYEFGMKNIVFASVGLFVQTVCVFVQGWMWWKAMEKIK